MGDTQAWFEGELRRMLGFDEVEEIARFALDSFSSSQASELREYLEQFLGQSEGVRKLCDELNARRRGDTSAAAPKPAPARSANASAGEDFWGAGGGSGIGKLMTASGRKGQGRGQERKEPVNGRAKGKVYQKSTVAEEDFWGGGTTSGKGRSGTAKSSASHPAPAPAPAPARSAGNGRKGTTEGGGGKFPPRTKARAVATKSSARPLSSSSSVGKPGSAEARGQSGKAASITSATGSRKIAPVAATTKAPEEPEKAAVWSGVTCLCMGKKHDVITNCTMCGKIACVEEGGFGCSFCASALPVTGREPRRSGENKKIGGGEEESADAAQSAALKEALARKDRLLLFDRTSASRTRVLDDQGDYFTSHNWLSREEREKAEAEEKARRDDAAQRRGARRQVKLSIDIMGRRVIEAKDAGDGEEPVLGRVEGVGGDERSGPAAQGTVEEGVRFGAAVATGVASQNGASDSWKESGNQRPSLENTGLRGRAKEVYDVMRANLAKQRRREGGGSSTKRGGFRVAEESRVSLWRVQHDMASDDVVRPNQIGGGYEKLDFEKFEPVDEVACK